MPKMIVLCADEESALLADAAATGGRSVRFMEVEVRAAGATVGRHRVLDDQYPLGDADAIVIAAASGTHRDVMETLFARLESQATNTTVLATTSPDPSVASRLMSLGGIAVSVRRDDGAASGTAESATALGAKAAKVAGWVRHALGHEAEHHAAHHEHHDHDHPHHHHAHGAADQGSSSGGQATSGSQAKHHS